MIVVATIGVVTASLAKGRSATHSAYEVIPRSSLVASEIDLPYRPEAPSEAAACGLLDRFRWLRGLLCHPLHQKDRKQSQSARHTFLCAWMF
jgi:hypothetical protein